MTSEEQTARPCRAAKLLAHGVAQGLFTIHQLSVVLHTDARTVGQYMSGLEPMPPGQQQRFAQFMAVCVPAMARDGRNLLARLEAERRYQSDTAHTDSGNALSA